MSRVNLREAWLTHRVTPMCLSASVFSPAIRSSRRWSVAAVRMETRAGMRQWLRSKWLTSSTSWMLPMRVETRGRARALQALYAWDLRSGEDLTRVAVKVWDDLAVAPDERKFAGGIVKTFAASSDALDAELTAVTDNWRLERIGAIERSVL